MEGVLVNMGAGKEGGRIDAPVKWFGRLILVDAGGYYNRTSVGGVMSKATDLFYKAAVLVTAADPHVEL